jgi:hypothetical protein
MVGVGVRNPGSRLDIRKIFVHYITLYTDSRGNVEKFSNLGITGD